jgi:hypothetical protein
MLPALHQPMSPWVSIVCTLPEEWDVEHSREQGEGTMPSSSNPPILAPDQDQVGIPAEARRASARVAAWSHGAVKSHRADVGDIERRDRARDLDAPAAPPPTWAAICTVRVAHRE